MNVRLTCTQAQYEALTETADRGAGAGSIAVRRDVLKALLVDQVQLRKAAERATNIIEPGSIGTKGRE